MVFEAESWTLFAQRLPFFLFLLKKIKLIAVKIFFLAGRLLKPWNEGGLNIATVS